MSIITQICSFLCGVVPPFIWWLSQKLDMACCVIVQVLRGAKTVTLVLLLLQLVLLACVFGRTLVLLKLHQHGCLWPIDLVQLLYSITDNSTALACQCQLWWRFDEKRWDATIGDVVLLLRLKWLYASGSHIECFLNATVRAMAYVRLLLNLSESWATCTFDWLFATKFEWKMLLLGKWGGRDLHRKVLIVFELVEIRCAVVVCIIRTAVRAPMAYRNLLLRGRCQWHSV